MAKLTRFTELERLPAESSWFEAYRLPHGVTAIYEPHHFQEVISYLIEGSERALLLDSGMGLGNMKAMVESLTDLPIVLVNSHSHFDHVGGDWQFGETHLLEVPAAIARIENGYALDPDDENLKPEALWYPGKAWFDLASYRIRPCAVRPIHSGDVFDLGRRQLTVLATPGHSDDSIMLYDADAKLLFTGDTVYPAPLYAHLAGPVYGKSAPEIYAGTIERIARSYADCTLVCSHNNPLWEGSALCEIASAFRSVLENPKGGEPQGEFRIHRFGEFSIIL